MTTNTISSDWKDTVRRKLAAAGQRDDDAIAEAFAQQAYTAVGNRDQAIMRDPYLLGFEIVEKNEDNSRLVGVFAFRVGGEILLVPVFYLNGQIKGQVLLYRKGANRFTKNSEDWVEYLRGKGDEHDGRGMRRGQLPDARISLHAGRAVQSPSYAGRKYGSAEDEEEAVDIQALWKEAAESRGTEPGHILADFLGDHDLGKLAAELVEREPGWADIVALTDGLDKRGSVEAVRRAEAESGEVSPGNPYALVGELLGKTAAEVAAAVRDYENAEPVLPAVTLLHEPPVGMGEAAAEDFYKRGYTLVDAREEDLSSLVRKEDPEIRVRSLAEPGMRVVRTKDGKSVKVFWGPTIEDRGDNTTGPSPCKSSGNLLVVMDGSDKGRVCRYETWADDSEKPVFVDGNDLDESGCEILEPGGSDSPDVGKTYLVWIESLSGFFRRPVHVTSKKKDGEVTAINVGVSGSQPAIMLRSDIDESDRSTLNGYGKTLILGSDAKFVEIDADVEKDDKGQIWDVSMKAPQTLMPLTLRGLQTDFLKHAHTLEVRDTPHGMEIATNGRTILTMQSAMKTACHLVCDVRLSPEDAHEAVDAAKANGKAAYHLFLPGALQRAMLEGALGSPIKEAFAGKTLKWIGGKLMPGLNKAKGIPAGVNERILKEINAYNALKAVDPARAAELKTRILGTLGMAGFSGGLISASVQNDESLGEATGWTALKDNLRAAGEEPWRSGNVHAEVRDFSGGLRERRSYSPTGEKLPNSPALERRLERGAQPPHLVDMGQGVVARPELRDAVDHYIETGEGTPGVVDVPEQDSLSDKAKDTASGAWDKAKEFGGDMRDKLQEVWDNPELQKALRNPWVLGALGLGGAGLAYGGYRALRRKDEDEQEKEAGALSAYYERDLDPETEFMIDDVDDDLMVPLDVGGHQAQVLAIRHQAMSPERRYLDALGYGGARNAEANLSHIPDEVILGMMNPAREMAEIGQRTGMKTLIDHGAVGTMAKVFDAAPYIIEYVQKLEGSLDYLGRLLFMLWWKPKDFKDMFGDDDLVGMENKLTAVFDSYGDVVLELLQRTEDS